MGQIEPERAMGCKYALYRSFVRRYSICVQSVKSDPAAGPAVPRFEFCIKGSAWNQ